MHTYIGQPLIYFKHLRDLLRVVCDVVKGEQLKSYWIELDDKQLYHSCRILHCNVSVGNVVIVPRNNETVG